MASQGVGFPQAKGQGDGPPCGIPVSSGRKTKRKNRGRGAAYTPRKEIPQRKSKKGK